MKKQLRSGILILVVLLSACGGNNEKAKPVYEEKPREAKAVYDYAKILSDTELENLDSKLTQYYEATSTQIVVVTVTDLLGEDISSYAIEIGDRWGVGQADKDNGIVVLIKSKSGNEKGDAFIATGEGVEGVIPDITAKEIIDMEMIPSFKEGNYYEGLDKATNVMMQLCNEEFTPQQYSERHEPVKKSSSPLAVIIPIIVLFLIFGGLFGRGRNMKKGSIGRNIPLLILLGMMGSGSRHGGSFGNFSSGSGGFGGGFGGGSFGGGGAGGSW
ncbi:MAG: TPM domain-containing protein [Bacteroidales bacterium]|nr:TPM domain-containing protein [Bacteroidales bacterium]